MLIIVLAFTTYYNALMKHYTKLIKERFYLKEKCLYKNLLRIFELNLNKFLFFVYVKYAYICQIKELGF